MSKMRTGNQTYLRRHYRECLLFLAVLAVTLYMALAPEATMLKWFNNDDGFYYFQVAKNILAGKGISFDGISLTNGFHPLWLVICLPIFAAAKGDLILPLRLVAGVFGLLQFLSMLVVYRALARRTSPNLAWLLAGFLGLNWVTYNNLFTGGLESALAFFLVACLCSAGQAYRSATTGKPGRLIWVGLLAGLTVLSRLDTVFLAIFLGVWLVLENRRDASELLTDAILALGIPVLVSILRLGFGISPLQKQIIFYAVIGFAASSVSGFITGRFSLRPFIIKPLARRIAGVIITGTLLVLSTGLALVTRLLPNLSLSLFVGVTALWSLTAALGPYPQFVSGDGKLARAGMPRTFTRWLPTGLAYFVPFASLLGGYMLWSQLNFGTPMPVSGQIKHWWGSLAYGTYGAPIGTFMDFKDYLLGANSPFAFLARASFLPWVGSLEPAWLAAGMLLLLLAAWLVLARLHPVNAQTRGAWLIFPLSAAVFYRVIYFYVSGYSHIRAWYWVAETFFCFVLIAGVLSEYLNRSQKARHVRAVWLSAVVLTLPAVLWFGSRMAAEYRYNHSAENAYMTEARSLENVTPAGAVIGMTGGGSVSYFIQERTIVNLDGLMNNKTYFDALRAGDISGLMREFGIQYIYANQYMVTSGYPYKNLLAGHLIPTDYSFDGSTLFQYTP